MKKQNVADEKDSRPDEGEPGQDQTTPLTPPALRVFKVLAGDTFNAASDKYEAAEYIVYAHAVEFAEGGILTFLTHVVSVAGDGFHSYARQAFKHWDRYEEILITDSKVH